MNILSVFSWASGAGAYGASNAALWSLTNSLRLELAEQGTQVLGVHAGFIDTQMVTAIKKPKSSPEPRRPARHRPPTRLICSTPSP